MKTATVLVAAALVATCSAGALAQGPKQREAERLALFQRYASPPQNSMHYFRIEGFEYLGKNAQGEDAMALWTGVNTAWLLTLQPPCLNIDFANAIGLTSTSGEVNVHMDWVKYGRHGQQCQINSIRKVDYKGVRAAMKGAQSESGGT